MLKTTPTTLSPIAETLQNQLDRCRQFPAALTTASEGNPLHWLAAQPAETKIAWLDRDGGGITAAVGAAAREQAQPGDSLEDVVRACRAKMQGLPTVRMFGGFSFDGRDHWDHFGAGQFVIPRLSWQDDHVQLVVMGEDDVPAASRALAELREPSAHAAGGLTAPGDIEYQPCREGWQANVDQALTLIRSEVLEKVVLARRARLRFPHPVDPIELTARLADATHDCFVFCLQFHRDAAFVGATPERLFKRLDRQLWSEVVAGTRRRGATAGEDQRLAYDLLTSDKDQLEHDIVRKSIRQKLHHFVEHLEVDHHASVLRLARKQHLCSEVTATLKPDVEEGALLRCLHPTPAVGGYPAENAIPEISRLEPFNRGWYAAPIGWLGPDGGEFVVAIRSGLIERDALSLYSGAGIVQGSDPDCEWEEIENKIQDFVEIFAGE